MVIFKGVSAIARHSAKRRLKAIAAEVGFKFNDSFLEYVQIDKFYYHLIEFLYGVPGPLIDKYDSPSRVDNFPKLLQDIEKHNDLNVWVHHHLGGNVFHKTSMEKVAAAAKRIPETDLKTIETKKQLMIRIEIILKKFVNPHIIVIPLAGSSLDRRVNKGTYFHESIHVLFEMNGIHWKSEWYYNEGLTTYFEAKYSIKGDRSMDEKLRIFREMGRGSDPKYDDYAGIWNEIFKKHPDKSKLYVIQMMLHNHK